ncbi:MAG: hypothetical protein Q9170_005569 [Blastenia crenularia]
MFRTAVATQSLNGSITSVGGRSMGARAAIMAAPTEMSQYVLVRDETLLGIPDTAQIIFVSGENDSICEITRLDAVREKMKCKTWRIVVDGADHGLTVKPKAGTKSVGLKTREVFAEWVRAGNLDGGHEGRISRTGRLSGPSGLDGRGTKKSDGLETRKAPL